MKNEHLKHIVEINFAIFLVGTSGPLGKFISLPPPVTIWFRCVLAAIFLGVFIRYQKINIKIHSKNDKKTIFISAVFLGVHWITYFYALRLSNVAIGMLSLFTYPVATALLTPLFFKTKLNIKHVILGLIVLIGIYFLTPEFNFENNYTKGVLFGLISSIFYSLRNILLKQKISTYHGSMLMFYQLVIVSFTLWPVLFLIDFTPKISDWQALITLALVTTAIGHTLFVMSFKNFSISTASIMSSIQPAYGILLGMLFLGEIPSKTTIIGGILIVSTVIIESFQPQKI